MMRTRHLALALLAVALVAPSAASAAWGPTQDMGPHQGPFAYDGNARGDRILVWQAETGLVFSKAGPGKTFGPPVPLGDPGPAMLYSQRSLAVELDERGNALLAWSYFDGTDPEFEVRGPGPCCDGLRARVIRRNGTVTSAKTLAPKGNSVFLQDMHIAPDGKLGIVFSRYSYESTARGVDSRFGTVTRGFGRREGVIRDAAGGPFALSFRRGRARLLNATSPDPPYSSARVTIRDLERRGTGRWRRLANALPSTRMVRDRLRFATAWNGQQVATWMNEERRGLDTTIHRVYAAARVPGRRFRVRRLGDDTYFQLAPPVIDAGGDALAAWPSVRRGSLVVAARRPSAGFGALTRFGPAADRIEIEGPRLDVNRRGHGLLVWTERAFDAGSFATRMRLVGAFRNTRGSALGHHVIVPEGDENSFFQYAVSLDRAGRGHVAYSAGGRLKVVAARIGG